MVKFETVTGAAYWACYLINGDASGLEQSEIDLCDAWREQNGIRDVVDTTRDENSEEAHEPYFSWSYGFHTGDSCSGGDLLDYVCEVETRA